MASGAAWDASKIMHPRGVTAEVGYRRSHYSELQGNQSIAESKVAFSVRPESAVWN
jgi:hypothetical protein